MKRPFHIHIGTEKTGSTAIQKYLKLNRNTLLSQYGVLIPHSLGNGTSVNLAAACQLEPKPDSLRTMRSLHTAEDVEHYYQSLASQLEGELQAKNPRRVLLSCENFSSRFKTDDEVRRLRDFIAPFCSDTQILIYLRRQDAMMVSAYTTKVRNGFRGRFTFPEEGVERHDCHYDKLLDRWARIFGEDSISVQLYERDRLHQEDVVADFCQCLDLPDNLAHPDTRENNSPKADLLEIVRQLNWHVPHHIDNKANPLRGNIVDLVTNTLSAGKLPPMQMDNADIRQRFRAGNEIVAKRWFSDDSSVPAGLFQPPSAGETQAGDVALEEEQLIAVCGSLWNACQQELRETRLHRDCLQSELYIAQGNDSAAHQLLEKLTNEYPEAPEPARLLARLDAVNKPSN